MRYISSENSSVVHPYSSGKKNAPGKHVQYAMIGIGINSYIRIVSARDEAMRLLKSICVTVCVLIMSRHIQFAWWEGGTLAFCIAFVLI